MVEAATQHALKVGGVVGLEHGGLTGQMVVPKPGNPETQSPCAQKGRQQVALGGTQGAHLVVGAHHRLGAWVIVQAGGQVDAPVVQAHCQIKQPGVHARKIKIEKEKSLSDSLDQIRKQDSISKLPVQTPDSTSKVVISTESAPSASDSLFQRKLAVKRKQDLDTVSFKQEIITTVDTMGLPVTNKKVRTEPLSDREKEILDSVIYDRGYITNAITMALNNARNLKNTFNIKMSQYDGHLREYRRYEIAWYQKYSQAIACFMMFLIGAPLGSIIKKGGLGLPVLISILFFILFYMLTITGEKWAKEGVTDPFFGTIFSNLCLLPFGLFFLRQARRDARLFEADFYTGMWKKLKQIKMSKKAI